MRSPEAELSWLRRLGDLRPSEIDQAAMAVRDMEPQRLKLELGSLFDHQVSASLEHLVEMAADLRAILVRAGFPKDALREDDARSGEWANFYKALRGASIYDLEAEASVERERKSKAKDIASPKRAVMRSKLFKPSGALVKVAGSKPIGREEVVSKVWEYIRSHNLWSGQQSALIRSDAVLRKVIGDDWISPAEIPSKVDAIVRSQAVLTHGLRPRTKRKKP